MSDMRRFFCCPRCKARLSVSVSAAYTLEVPVFIRVEPHLDPFPIAPTYCSVVEVKLDVSSEGPVSKVLDFREAQL